jgi:NAD(P)-dependent dehydrogenase (short-subunit alcohol dehydrogenase family)
MQGKNVAAPFSDKQRRRFVFEGKVVVITGAKGGLGTYVTRDFLNAGATVVGVSRSISAADFPSDHFFAKPGELSTAVAARMLTDEIVVAHRRIDVLVHLVGGFAGGTSVTDTDVATLDRMFDLNFRSAFHMAQAVLPHMQRQRSGRILAIGSKAAVEPGAMASAYSASKAALVSLILTIAQENKDLCISANVVLPATMDTPANRVADPQADVSKWVDPGQVAAMLLHLASDAASQVTGAVIPVYGRN